MYNNKMKPSDSQSQISIPRIIIKTLSLFIILNLLFLVLNPIPALGRVSIYNSIIPGRKRLPYSENPDQAYNLSLYNLDAMFASHELAGAQKASDEYRVILIGDSSTWGFLLPSDQTLSEHLNKAGIELPNGKEVRAYNLGYPVMSLTKDLLILSYAMRYEPDLIIWPLTLESFPYTKQLFPPLLQNNFSETIKLIEDNQLNLQSYQDALVERSLWDRTIIGSRRALADIIRLQLYGVMWAATGIDQELPETFSPPMEDLPNDEKFYDLEPINLKKEDLAFDVIEAGIDIAGDIPILFINEPMFISHGENSDVRYNFFYPRWAYDNYRQLLQDQSSINNWHYLDLWNVISPSEFTNSAVHLSSAGTKELAQMIQKAILELPGD